MVPSIPNSTHLYCVEMVDGSMALTPMKSKSTTCTMGTTSTAAHSMTSTGKSTRLTTKEGFKLPSETVYI